MELGQRSGRALSPENCLSCLQRNAHASHLAVLRNSPSIDQFWCAKPKVLACNDEARASCFGPTQNMDAATDTANELMGLAEKLLRRYARAIDADNLTVHCLVMSEFFLAITRCSRTRLSIGSCTSTMKRTFRNCLPRRGIGVREQQTCRFIAKDPGKRSSEKLAPRCSPATDQTVQP